MKYMKFFPLQESEEAKRLREERLAQYESKKAKKSALVSKSSTLLDMKPWDDETDMAKLEECVRSIQADGLVWGSSKLVPVGYGIKKFQIQCVVEDDKLGTDMLESRSLLLTSMYNLWTWLHSTRSKIHHGSVPLNKSLKDKKKNWLEPTQLKMAEDLTSSGP